MFDLENLNPATKFFWPNSDNKEWVELRIAADEDLLAMRKRLGIKEKVEYPVNPETRQVNRVVGTNVDEGRSRAINDELTDFCIADWLLLDAAGNQIPCTRENKLKLVKGHPPFAKWIVDCLNELRTGEAAQSEAETKN